MLILQPSRLLERVKQGQKVASIIIFDKGEDIGRGLAYSKASSSSIVNMHADTMGLCPINPLQYTEWIRKLSPELNRAPFPTRQQYGLYLTALKENLLLDCKKHDVKLDIVKSDVLDVRRGKAVLELSVADGRKTQARDVILALGNFCANSQKQFRGNPSYYRCPWPADKLKAIKSDTSVLIMGSRLAAIDVANFLAENGHQGPITFVSRGGRLPKVQGPPATFQQRYRLYVLAKEAESGTCSPYGVLMRIVTEIEDLVREFATSDFSELEKSCDPLEMLRSDIKNAENGVIPWQTVINTTKPLAERYWNCFSDEEKKHFCEKYNSLWVTYRHAIPIDNARKILAMMEKGQLKVVKGAKVNWDREEFLVQSCQQEYRGQVLVEALGQEFNISEIEVASLLLTNLVTSGIVKAHPLGGLQVDYKTSKAGEGLHVIGSLTRGVHFYTTAIDRNAAHASRIADSIVGLPFRRCLHIAFFIGSDLFSHLMLGKLVPELLALGHMPFIFMPSDNINLANKRPVPFELQELAFFERTLLQEHIIPSLGSAPREGAPVMTIEQMRTHHGIMVERVPDINTDAFINMLKDQYIDMGISLRCYQRFKTNIIQYFSKPQVLLNLHPGVLPQYRGVITAIRAMMNNDKEFGYSLHHIDEKFDAGNLIDVRTKPLDYAKSILGNMEGIYKLGVEMVLDAVENFARGGNMHESATPQDETKSRYYSFLTTEEMNICKTKGIKLVDNEVLEKFLVACFAGKGHESELRDVINKAVRLWCQIRQVSNQQRKDS